MKKTKIVATISDTYCEVDFIQSLYDAGMNVVRLNTAHQTLEGTQKIIDNTRKISGKIALLVDTKGPEVRTTQMKDPIEIKEGEEIKLKGDKNTESSRDCIYVTYNQFVRDVPVGSKILFDDGEIELVVERKDADHLHCKAVNPGFLMSKKSVNVPGVRINLPSLNEKDKTYVDFAIKNDLEFIAHSFVRNKEDINEIQKLLDEKKSKIKIIAKIENQEGFDNIDEILDHSYGVMVARGDLAIEMPYEKIPVVQNIIINKCIAKRKPVIIATQMLHSMINNPRPTRAEVSDIANAVLSQADAVMLSGETAFGKYPVEAVRTMAKVAEEAENAKQPINNVDKLVLSTEVSAWITKNAVQASVKLNARAIIIDTFSGRTVLNSAGFRGIKPIYAQCYSKRVMRELALSYGVFPEYLDEYKSVDDFVHEALKTLIDKNLLTKNDIVVIVAGNFGKHNGASFIEISDVQSLLN